MKKAKKGPARTAKKKRVVSKKGPQTIEWMTTEFPYFHKRPGFEWGLAIITLILIAIFVGFGQYLLSLILALAAIALWQLANQKPRRMKVTINQEGISFQGKTYAFDKLFGFWLTYPSQGEGPLLHLQTKGFPHHTEVISLADQNPEVVRKILKKHLPERHFRVSLSERLLEKLGI